MSQNESAQNELRMKSKGSEGLTLGDLITYVSQASAMGVKESSQVQVRVGFRAQVKEIWAKEKGD